MIMIDLQKVPKNPGCYLFQDSKKNIIYIGKAKDLKKRVSSYFNKNHEDNKTKILVSQIKYMEFIVTDTESEALILENNLIKKYTPKYNIDLKDSKRYAYLEITDEKYPRLIIARKRKNTGKYYGPFVSAQKRDYIKEHITKTFRLRTCRKVPKKECLRYHIGLCDAPCTNKVSQKDYNIEVKQAEMVLSGNINQTINLLKKRMVQYSKDSEFEKAIAKREQINSIEWLKEKQKMERNRKYDEDIINFIQKNNKIYLILFNIHKGTLENKQSYVFDYEKEYLESFLMQYYNDHEIPKEIILPIRISDALKEVFTKKTKQKINFTIPQKGEKKKLLELVKKNIEIEFFKEEESLLDLKNKLRLQEIPSIIECFDISHISGTSPVA